MPNYSNGEMQAKLILSLREENKRLRKKVEEFEYLMMDMDAKQSVFRIITAIRIKQEKKYPDDWKKTVSQWGELFSQQAEKFSRVVGKFHMRDAMGEKEATAGDLASAAYDIVSPVVAFLEQFEQDM